MNLQIEQNAVKCKDKRMSVSRLYRYFSTLLHSVHTNRINKTRKCDLTSKQLCDLWKKQEGRCSFTGILMTYSHRSCDKHITQHLNASLDRIDSNGHYTITNISLVCNVLNHCKNNYTNDEFYTICKIVTQNNLMHNNKTSDIFFTTKK